MHAYRLRSLASLLAIVLAGACTSAAASAVNATAADTVTVTNHDTQTVSVKPPVRDLFPGIPDKPDLVTVVPFYTKPNETPLEQTKAVIEAEIDGHRGVFIFDLAAGAVVLNRTFLQPNAKGGVDTVTDANRTKDPTPRESYMNDQNFDRFDRTHVTVRIGTLTSDFDDPQLMQALHATTPHRYNALLGHMWGNFSWVFAPRLGNIGPAATEPFEAIVDYTHKRLVLIKLDSAGLRLAEVPAYTPRWTGSLLHVPAGLRGLQYLGIKVMSGNVLDTLTATNNTETRFIDTGAPGNDSEMLGYPFLSAFGAFGINQRAHQFILYH